MKVILLKDVENLGPVGAVVNVAEGHARNFLFPRKLAMPADKKSTRHVQKRKIHLERKDVLAKEEAERAVERMKDMRVKVFAKVGEGTKLFGSITHADIQHALERAGIVVDRRKIEFDGHISNLGEYTVPVRLHRDMVASFTLEVVPEGEE